MTHQALCLSVVLVLFTLLSCCESFLTPRNFGSTNQRCFVNKLDVFGQVGTLPAPLRGHEIRRLPIITLSSQLSNDSDSSWLLPSPLQYSFPFSILIASFILVSPLLASAGDFTGRDISGQNLSNGNYMQQDFSGIKAVGTNFRNSNLQGCNFNKADLSSADLSGSDVRGASFQGSILDGALFKDVMAAKATFSASILDIKSLENTDLTDSLWPSQLQIMICDMSELLGTSSNGVVTRDSILCN